MAAAGARRRRLRGDRSDDGGFVLLETIVAIALITVLMVALTSLFLSAMQTTAHQRALQNAIRIVTDEGDQARGMGAAGALSGRDKTSVQTQFTAAPAAVRAWLSTSADQAYDDTAVTGQGQTACSTEGSAGRCATLPTTSVGRTLDDIDFAVSYYEEWCYRNAADKTTADCVPSASKVTGTTYNQYLRVITAISWTDSSCPSGGCSYLSSMLLNGTAEPLFYFNDKPPPLPDVSACTPPAIAVGDTVNLDITGSDGFCAMDGGVPPFTWGGTGLPAGLAILAAGSVTGSPTTAGTVSGAQLTVTDAFLRTGSSPTFSWTVYPRLTLNALSDRTGTQGVAITAFTIGASGGQGAPYTYAASGLPPGITLSTTGSFSGTPTRAGVYPVTVTVTDASKTRTATGTFTWTIAYPPLVAQSPGDQGGTVSAAISPLTLTATGGSGHYVYSDPGATLPTGLSLAGNTITGTPTGAGSYPISLTVTDDPAGTSTTVSFTWTVNPPPAVSPPPNTTTAPGGTVTGQAVGSAGTAPYTYALQGNPSWLHIDRSTGTLSGTATSTIADYPGIVIVLTDASGAVAQSAPFTWSVYQVPTLAPPGDQTTDLGGTVSLPLQVTCGATPCTFSSTGLPSWLTLDPATGLITGTAPSVQTVVTGITVTVTDARGTTASSQFGWIVGPQQTITSPGDQVWTVQSKMDATSGLQIAATCAAAPCRYALAGTSGALPTGLSLNTSTGLITGTPTKTGSYSGIVVTVTNANNKTATAAPFTWTINAKPTLTSPGNQRTAVGGVASLQLNATCLSTPCVYSSTSLPYGLTLDPNSGLISGSPTSAAQTSTITVNVTDKTGASASRTFTWYVLGLSIPPQSTDTTPRRGSCRSTTSVTLTLTNYLTTTASSPTFSVVSGPSWLSISGNSLNARIPCNSKSSWVTIRVTDSGGSAPSASATSTFQWTIT